MRLLLVLLSVVLALVLWVWATGPGTSLPLAVGGWIFCAIVGRIAYVLLKPRIEDQNSPSSNRPPAPSTVIRPAGTQPSQEREDHVRNSRGG